MRAVAAALFLASAPALADAPSLAWPMACTLGTSCTIEDYMDLDPGAGQQDFMCAPKSRDGHRGTDIHLLSFDAMEQGVDIYAAAPGRVDALRDGLDDVAVTPETRAEISRQGCGNAVRIDHGDGWQTLYCHLKKGSISVGHDQIVQQGDVLGQVGLSGLTNAPHLHLTVLKDGAPVDPFLPVESNTTCGTVAGPGLWAEPVAYDRTGFFTIGFSTGIPEFDAVDSGAARVTETDRNSALVLYGYAFFARPGDIMRFWAQAPDGAEVYRKDIVLDDPKKRFFRAFGRRPPRGGWAEGRYIGYVQILRAGRILAHRHTHVSVD